uniref:Uncharacterized protein n=1 Tax=Glossina palpalis gambiensis TaxID=67801 RepID=A0A1B0B2Y5_9MUSC
MFLLLEKQTPLQLVILTLISSSLSSSSSSSSSSSMPSSCCHSIYKKLRKPCPGHRREFPAKSGPKYVVPKRVRYVPNAQRDRRDGVDPNGDQDDGPNDAVQCARHDVAPHAPHDAVRHVRRDDDVAQYVRYDDVANAQCDQHDEDNAQLRS